MRLRDERRPGGEASVAELRAEEDTEACRADGQDQDFELNSEDNGKPLQGFKQSGYHDWICGFQRAL